VSQVSALATFQNVSKSYGAFRALNEISFELRPGEIFGFIGPNGAGKTTTMKILVGLLSDFTGVVEVDGLSMPDKRDALYTRVGYMPQAIAFQEWRTVRHALTTFGRLSGLTVPFLSHRIPEVLYELGLRDAMDRKVMHLSGGMTQKLGLAQALLHDPRLLVLDEPVAGMDPGSRIQVKSILKGLRDRGVTVIFSSHILSDVQDVADRIGIIAKGEMLKIGTLGELKDHFSVNDDIELVLSHDAGTWRELASIAGILGAEETRPGVIVLHLRPGADVDFASNEALTRLVKTGNRIRSFHPVVPSLDQLYLKYVGEGAAP